MPETLVQKLMKRACITLDENSTIKNLIDTLKSTCKKYSRDKTGKRPLTNINLVRI